jgi:hypothetical protein
MPLFNCAMSVATLDVDDNIAAEVSFFGISDFA